MNMRLSSTRTRIAVLTIPGLVESQDVSFHACRYHLATSEQSLSLNNSSKYRVGGG